MRQRTSRWLAGTRQGCRWLLVAPLLGVLLVTGCSREFTNSPSQHGPSMSASLSDVQDKIGLLQHDTCFTGDPHRVFSGCGGRYLTEVRNIALAARDQAAKKPAAAARVSEVATTLQNGVNSFNGHACDTTTPSDPGRCAADLQTINAGLSQLSGALRSIGN